MCEKMKAMREEIVARMSDPKTVMVQQKALMGLLHQYDLTIEDWANLKALLKLRHEFAHPRVHPADIPEILNMWRQMMLKD